MPISAEDGGAPGWAPTTLGPRAQPSLPLWCLYEMTPQNNLPLPRCQRSGLPNIQETVLEGRGCTSPPGQAHSLSTEELKLLIPGKRVGGHLVLGRALHPYCQMQMQTFVPHRTVASGTPGWLSGWASAFGSGRDLRVWDRVPARSPLLPLPLSLTVSHE